MVNKNNNIIIDINLDWVSDLNSEGTNMLNEEDSHTYV